MTIRSSAGTIISICENAPATFDDVGYEALTYTEVGEITNADGQLGRVYALITFMRLASRGTVKLKGSFNDGSITLNLGLDHGDAGQQLASQALVSDLPFSFKIELQNGNCLYFQGLVMSFPTTIGGTDAVTAGTIQVEITTSNTGVGVVLVEA